MRSQKHDSVSSKAMMMQSPWCKMNLNSNTVTWAYVSGCQVVLITSIGGNPNIGFQEWVGLNAVWLFSRNTAMKRKIWWWPRAAIMVIWMLKVQSPAWLLSVSWVRMTQHWHLHEGPRRFDKEQLFMAVIQRPYRGLSLIWQFVGMYKHLTHKFLM